MKCDKLSREKLLQQNFHHAGLIKDGFCSMRHLGQMTRLFQSVSCPSKIWSLQCRCMRSHQLPMNPREWILAIKPWLSSHIGPIQDGFCSMRHFGQMTTLFQSVSCPSKIWPLQCRCMQGHQLPMSLRNGAKPLSLGYQAIQDQYRMDFAPRDILVK